MRRLRLDLHGLRALGAALAACDWPGQCLLLSGEMGSGKTTLAQAIIHALLGHEVEVTSPTYTLLHPYEMPGGRTLIHMDAYRMEHDEELAALGLQDMLGRTPMIIEWPEKLASHTPADYGFVHLTIAGETVRDVRVGHVGTAPHTWQESMDAARF